MMTNPEEIMSVKDTVLKVVREKPYTRESYWKLYFEVLLELGICKTSRNSGYFIPYAHLKDLISPETISRAYRLLKADDPSLCPKPKVEEQRREREAQMNDINLHWQPNGITTNNQKLLIPYEGEA